MRILTALIVLLLVFALPACGGDEQGGELAPTPQEAVEGQQEDDVSSIEQVQTAVNAEGDCEEVPDAVVARIAEELTGGADIRYAQAVKSRANDVYYVSAEIHGSTGLRGDDDLVGTWAVNTIEADTGVYALEGVAQDYSDWPEQAQAAPALSPDDPAARTSQGCTRAQVP